MKERFEEMKWTEGPPPMATKIERIWTCGPVRVEKVVPHGYRTFYNGEPANLGLFFPTLDEAKKRVTLWVINGMRNELDMLGISHKITEPKQS